MRIPGTPAAARSFFLDRGPVTAALQQNPGAHAEILGAIDALVARHHDGAGWQHGSAAWRVRAVAAPASGHQPSGGR